MAETASGIYYPTTDDPVRVPADMQKLAESIDAQRGHLWVPGVVSQHNTPFGALSTPIKVELPQVKPSQLIEVFLRSWMFRPLSGEAKLRLSVAGQTPLRANGTPLEANTSTLEAGKAALFTLGPSGFAISESGTTATQVGENSAALESEEIPRLLTVTPVLFKAPVKRVAPLVIELQAATTVETMSVQGAYLAARIWG